MSEDRKKILELLAAQDITAEEAEKLMQALDDEPSKATTTMSRAVHDKKSLCINIEPLAGSDNDERVNIRVPFALVRAGVKLGALMPESVNKNHNVTSTVNQALADSGVDMNMNQMSSENMEALVESLQGLDIDMESDGQRITICCE